MQTKDPVFLWSVYSKPSKAHNCFTCSSIIAKWLDKKIRHDVRKIHWHKILITTNKKWVEKTKSMPTIINKYFCPKCEKQMEDIEKFRDFWNLFATKHDPNPYNPNKNEFCKFSHKFYQVLIEILKFILIIK